MKRIFMLMALASMLVAAMALSGVAQAAGSPTARCKQEAANLGIVGSYNFVGGNNKKNDNFSSKATAGPDVFCGFGGDEYISQLDADDIFIGGAGVDTVQNNYGTVYGGAGDDTVFNIFDGALFYGGDGPDYASSIQAGGTFYGGDGPDYAAAIFSGTFYGGADNDFVTDLYGGFYYGDLGNDELTNYYGGFLDSVEVVPLP